MTPLISAAIVGVLWLLTILASDAPWAVITAFWSVAWGVLTVWVRREARKSGIDAIVPGLESALRRSEADVVDIRARAFVEFEEIEDEGACYAFAVDDERVVFVSGQEFYPEARFPSLDFSLVYMLDEAGRTVDMAVEKRGAKADPVRVVPAEVKKTLDIPEHLEMREVALSRLEETLRSSS